MMFDMKTLLACSSALILLVLAPALSGETALARERNLRNDTSRPLMEMREVVGVTTSEDHIDVYWLHTNELLPPVRPTLYRSRVSADGSSRLSTTGIHQFDENQGARVSGAGSNVQVLWNGRSQIMVSPLEGDALKYANGKPIGWGQYAELRCHATECVAVYDVGNVQMATILDSDSNVVSGPFALPSGSHPRTIRFDERGMFFVRHTLDQLRAALVRRDGSVQYDVRLASADPLAFHTTHPGVTTTGSGYFVAFTEFTTAPDEIHAVTIGADGSLSAPTRLLQVEEHRDLPNSIGGLSLAASGSSVLLGGSYVIGRPFLVLLDASLQRESMVVRADASPSVHPHPNGSSFVVVWHAASPYLTILHHDGSSTAPVPLVPSRRRPVR
jgi:hypothetical protein